MIDETVDYETLWNLYSPKPNPWFSSTFTYEGWGIATFEKPAGTVEGPTKIVINETGELRVEMEFEKLNTSVTIYGNGNFKFIKFVQGIIGSKGTENQCAFGVNTSNPCLNLTIQTDVGIFASSGNVSCWPDRLGMDGKCEFFISEGTYEVKSSDKPKYWVVPLTNFVSVFHPTNHPEWILHPLRVFKASNIPATLDEKQRQIAFSAAIGTNLLIRFNFGEKVGYIQPVLDYNEKEEKLKSGEIKLGITALMISELTSNLEAVWFPYDYTNLLSFALGLKVSAPWIEFRDEKGDLVSRKHIIHFADDYQRGYAAINEAIYGGLGELISLASNSPEFGKSYFRVLVGHLVRLQSHTRQMEDHMDLLCRTFDTLCEEFKYDVQNLITHLPDSYQIEIKKILHEASKKVKVLPYQLDKSSRPDLLPILNRVADRTISAYNKDRDFGLAVRDLLLNKYAMPDVAIMEKYYTDNGVKEKFWEQTLTKYRGAAVHTGYFANGKYDGQNIMQLQDHLHDILVRLTLKILDYKGNYQPRVIKHLVDGKTVNWLTKDTPATELGYKSPIA